MKRPCLKRGRPVVAVAAALISQSAAVCPADVVVLGNKTGRAVTARVGSDAAPPVAVQLSSGEVRPFWSDDRQNVTFSSGAERRSYDLDPNAVYFFGETADGVVDLQKIGLGGDESTATGRRLPPGPGRADAGVITVQIYSDDDEPTRRVIWEKKLRDRVAEASKILSRHSGMRLRVVGVGEWTTDNGTNDFAATLTEFERTVNPSPARLAIGFTSQYEVPRGRVRLGGTRGPLRRHLLLREWSRHVSERERLELLLHELGHFLGASHSPQPDSVMRPVLGDKQANLKAFDIRFDAVNTLAIAMVSEEIRRRGVQRFGALTSGTKRRLSQIYGVLGQALPDDPAAKHFQTLAGSATRGPLGGPTRVVLRAIVASAAKNRYETGGAKGDALTERYVAAAAAAAAQLPKKEGAKAFLLALGIAIDDSATLRSLPLTRRAVETAERNRERKARLAVLGEPTVEGRRDLAKHFFVSAHLAAAGDAKTAGHLGLAKEALDAQGGSGFSFVDMAANRAGVRFAESVLAGRLRLERLATGFHIGLFMPAVDGLPEGLSNEELIERFGGPGDARFEKQLGEIDQRINDLPPYAPLEIKL